MAATPRLMRVSRIESVLHTHSRCNTESSGKSPPAGSSLVLLQHSGDVVAQTIETYVGNTLDEAKISPLHKKVIALIAAGYFFDVIDFTIFGSLVPYLISSKFGTGAGAAPIGRASDFGG